MILRGFLTNLITLKRFSTALRLLQIDKVKQQTGIAPVLVVFGSDVLILFWGDVLVGSGMFGITRVPDRISILKSILKSIRVLVLIGTDLGSVLLLITLELLPEL
ncbi:MAG: hypothetical protein JOS17DRAFT_760810 [Linnemannia elongata]|nr:MAG: hypothetical protein JOS17DRAFT_760810 [Linnemannia elongata]